MRVVKIDPAARTRAVGDIFVGEVEAFTAVGAEHSRDLRLSDIHFKDGAANRWHVHTTDQILVVTDGDGFVETDTERHDLTRGVVVLVPANTRHRHGAKPGRDVSHWSILGPGDSRIVD